MINTKSYLKIFKDLLQDHLKKANRIFKKLNIHKQNKLDQFNALLENNESNEESEQNNQEIMKLCSLKIHLKINLKKAHHLN